LTISERAKLISAISGVEFQLLVNLALWLCIVPFIVILIGWIWGFWEALIASLAVLLIMIILCLPFCQMIRLRMEKTWEPFSTAIGAEERRQGLWEF
jgi:hypothetical protein